MQRRWILPTSPDEAGVRLLASELGIPAVVAVLL
ncbi:MAG: hypothetical protein RLZZ408_1324, partial [Verrucomicrobiota bacterium]